MASDLNLVPESADLEFRLRVDCAGEVLAGLSDLAGVGDAFVVGDAVALDVEAVGRVVHPPAGCAGQERVMQGGYP